MSVRLVAAVTKDRLEDATAGQRVALKAILYVLAEHANADGVAWPSVDLIAAEACLSPRQVQRHLATLEEHGRITATAGRRLGGTSRRGGRGGLGRTRGRRGGRSSGAVPGEALAEDVAELAVGELGEDGGHLGRHLLRVTEPRGGDQEHERLPPLRCEGPGLAVGAGAPALLGLEGAAEALGGLLLGVGDGRRRRGRPVLPGPPDDGSGVGVGRFG